MDGGANGWTNVTGWESSPPTVAVNGSAPGTTFRAQSNVTDSVDQTKTSNSSTPVVGVPTNIGTKPLHLLTLYKYPDNTTFTVSWDGSYHPMILVYPQRSCHK